MVQKEDSQTVARKKIDSQLLSAIKQRDEAQPGSTALSPAGIRIDKQGRVLVDIRAEVTPRLSSKIRDVGGEVVESFARYQSIVARVPLDKLEEIAALKEVRFIAPAPEAITN